MRVLKYTKQLCDGTSPNVQPSGCFESWDQNHQSSSVGVGFLEAETERMQTKAPLRIHTRTIPRSFAFIKNRKHRAFRTSQREIKSPHVSRFHSQFLIPRILVQFCSCPISYTKQVQVCMQCVAWPGQTHP